jgi:hypothetical protein
MPALRHNMLLGIMLWRAASRSSSLWVVDNHRTASRITLSEEPEAINVRLDTVIPVVDAAVASPPLTTAAARRETWQRHLLSRPHAHLWMKGFRERYEETKDYRYRWIRPYLAGAG